MSHHNKELYPRHNTLEIRAEMALHGLTTDSPSQISDSFRFGYIAAQEKRTKRQLIKHLRQTIELDLSGREEQESILQELIQLQNEE